MFIVQFLQKCLNMKEEKNLDSKRRCEHSRLKTLAQRDIVRHGRMHFRATIIQWYFCKKKNIITYLLDCQMVNFSLLKLEERVCELDQWLYKKPSPEKKYWFHKNYSRKEPQYFVQYELILNFSGTLLTQLLASPSSSVANNTESPSRTVLKKNLPPSKSKHKLRCEIFLTILISLLRWN